MLVPNEYKLTQQAANARVSKSRAEKRELSERIARDIEGVEITYLESGSFGLGWGKGFDWIKSGRKTLSKG